MTIFLTNIQCIKTTLICVFFSNRSYVYVTIIFDGITDLSSSVVKRLVKRNLLPEAKIIVTCRPDDEDEELFSEDSVRVEVKGFSEQSIKTYLTSTLGEEHKKVLDNLELFSLCHCLTCFLLLQLLDFDFLNLFFLKLLQLWTDDETLNAVNKELCPQLTHLILYSDWRAAGCQRSAVLLWAQLWSPTPPTWDTWSWALTSCRIQEWSIWVVFWRVQTVDWRLWGQFTDCYCCRS